MEEQGIFKTSVFGGFDKQSVLNYVDEMIKKGQEREQELLSRCEDAERERDMYRQKYAEEGKKSAGLSEKAQQLEKAQQSLAEKEGQLEALRTREESSRAQVEELRRQLAECEEKSHKYDEVASQIGVVMVEAQKQADVIIARAHVQAEQVAQEAISNIYNINKRLDQAMEDAYRLRTYAAQTMQSFDEQMAQLDIFIKESAGRLYIGAGNTGLDESRYAQPYAQEPPYAYVSAEDAAQAAPPAQGAFAGAAPDAERENPDFFPQPAGV